MHHAVSGGSRNFRKGGGGPNAVEFEFVLIPLYVYPIVVNQKMTRQIILSCI